MIIHHGQLVVSGPVAELRRGDRPRLAVRVTGDGDASWAAGLGPATGTVDAVRADGTAEISITSAADSHPLHPGDAGQQAGRRGQAWLQRVRETAVRPVRPVSQNVAALAAQGSKWPHSTRSVVKSEDREGRSAAHFFAGSDPRRRLQILLSVARANPNQIASRPGQGEFVTPLLPMLPQLVLPPVEVLAEWSPVW